MVSMADDRTPRGEARQLTCDTRSGRDKGFVINTIETTHKRGDKASYMSDIRPGIVRFRDDVAIEIWLIAAALGRYLSVVVNHVISASSSAPPMGRHPKAKKSTLTKIDPAILRPKPQTISQHASHAGVPVTTPVNPVRDPPEILLEEPAAFNADPSNFKGDYSEDGFSEEEVVRDYYITRVRYFSVLQHAEA